MKDHIVAVKFINGSTKVLAKKGICGKPSVLTLVSRNYTHEPTFMAKEDAVAIISTPEFEQVVKAERLKVTSIQIGKQITKIDFTEVGIPF